MEWKLSEEVKNKNGPILEKFLNKLENMTTDEVANAGAEEFTLDLTNSGLSPQTLILLLILEFGYDKKEMTKSGWAFNFAIDMAKEKGTYESTCEKLKIHGCGMTFELKLSVSKFM